MIVYTLFINAYNWLLLVTHEKCEKGCVCTHGKKKIILQKVLISVTVCILSEG